MTTLIDEVIRETYRKRSLIPVMYRDTLIRARKFVLDEGMSGHLADLTNAPFLQVMKGALEDLSNQSMVALATKDERTMRRGVELADGARRMARLPHPVTWIEYDMIARRRRSMDEYPSTQIPTSGSLAPEQAVMPRLGWLLEQHPTSSAVRMTVFVDMTRDFGEVGVLPFAYTWVADDNDSLPWPNLMFDTRGGGRDASEIAHGMLGHKSRCSGVTWAQFVKDEHPSKAAVQEILFEMIGELRCAWTFLATINDLPVVLTGVKPQKGYVAKGQYRRFVEHAVVRLQVPTTRMRSVALRALATMRRRAHEVRGHWRHDWRHPAVTGCQHIWINADEETLQCPHCKGRRIWIAAHQRGDSRLGFVNHDYSVERGELHG